MNVGTAGRICEKCTKMSEFTKEELMILHIAIIEQIHTADATSFRDMEKAKALEAKLGRMWREKSDRGTK